MSDTLLASWITGARSALQKLPPHKAPPTDDGFRLLHDGDEPLVQFPIVDEAVRDLSSRQLVTRDQFDRLSDNARLTAFTVAKVASEDAMEKIRQALVEDVREGGTLREFRQKVQEAMGRSWLSPSQIETVYRTNVGIAYSRGLDEVLKHPAVQGEFYFEKNVPIRDSRLSDICEVVSHSGIQGTGIYAIDDPEWNRVKPPRHPNCRCGRRLMTLEDAAKEGIRFAQDWLRLGHQPGPLPFVKPVPVELPKGWVR